MSAGARDNISPRARLEYYPGYYAADVCDPDGIRSRSSIRASTTAVIGPVTAGLSDAMRLGGYRPELSRFSTRAAAVAA
jgi:hypothetical protein